MKRIIYFLLLAFSAVVNAAVDTTPQQNVDFRKYAGRWYEQARFENWFEEGMEHVYTDYTLLQNGSLRVSNHGTSPQGYAEQATGRAFIVAPGELSVSFVWPYWWFRAPYKVLYVDSEYQSALVSGEDATYLWLLTREPVPATRMLKNLVEQAKLRGFDTSRLRYTKHQNRKSTAPDTKMPG